MSNQHLQNEGRYFEHSVRSSDLPTAIAHPMISGSRSSPTHFDIDWTPKKLYYLKVL
jgi:hypothetical protein